MGAIYEVGVVTAAALAGAPYLAIRPPASNGPCVRVREVHLIESQTTQSNVGLVRALTVGTPTTSVLGQARNKRDAASQTNIDTAWAVTPPTIAGTPVYFRRGIIAATVGNGAIWTFPEPHLIEPGDALLLWNWGASGGGALVVNVVYEE